MIDLQWHPPGGRTGDLSGEPLLGELSNLAKRRVSWKAGKRLGGLERAVRSLRQVYGPLRENDTPEGWLRLAVVARLHLNLYRALADEGPRGFLEGWETRHDELTARQETDEEELRRRERYAQRFPDLTSRFPDRPELKGVRIVETPVFTNRDALEEAELDHLELIRAIVMERGNRQHTSTIKRTLARGLYDQFGTAIHIQPYGLLVQHWGARALCPVDTWLYAALSALWRGGHPVEVCAAEGCGTPFLKTHASTMYCKESCAVDHLRQRQARENEQRRAKGLLSRCRTRKLKTCSGSVYGDTAQPPAQPRPLTSKPEIDFCVPSLASLTGLADQRILS